MATVCLAAVPAPQQRLLIDEGFEDDAYQERGWYDSRPLTLSSVERHGGQSSLEVRFPAGARQPAWGGVRRQFAATATVYLSYWVKYSANWRGSARPYHPHEFLLLTTADDRFVGPAYTHLTAYVEHSVRNGEGVPVVSIQDGRNVDESAVGRDLTGVTEHRGVAGCNGSSDAWRGSCYVSAGRHVNGKSWRGDRAALRAQPGPGYLGNWNHVEAEFRLNSIRDGVGVADGAIRYWFNGALLIDAPGVLLRTGAHPRMGFNQVFIGPYIGDGSPIDQTMWIDDVQVGTARP